MRKAALTSIAVALFAVTAVASTDPFLGTWILNPKQSKYPGGACPKRMVIEMEPAGEGIRYRSDTTFNNGATAHAEYTAEYNGKQALVMGNRGMLWPVFLKRTDARTVVASYTKDLKVVASSRRAVSKDGRTMTITTVSKDASGKSVTTVGIYERKQARK